jgi:hypothetical protein
MSSSWCCWSEKVNIADFLFITIIITLRIGVYLVVDIRIYEFLWDFSWTDSYE